MGLMASIEEQGDIGLGLKSLYLQKIVQSMFQESKERKNEIHVTDLVYECLRRAYLRKKLFLPTMDYKSILRVWIGRQIHIFPLLEEHELALEWEGIHCRIDEFEDGFLLDKKSTRGKIPSSVRPHHKIQLEYYRAIMDELEYPVIKAAIAYINVGGDVDIKVLPVEFSRSLDVVKKEMLERKDRLSEFLEMEELPKRHLSWLCRYCDWCNLCFLKDESIKRIIGMREVK